MKTLSILVLLGMTGCANLPNYKASELKSSVSVPMVFKNEVAASGVTKELQPDGTYKRKAAQFDHNLTIGPFVAQTSGKDVELDATK